MWFTAECKKWNNKKKIHNQTRTHAHTHTVSFSKANVRGFLKIKHSILKKVKKRNEIERD